MASPTRIVPVILKGGLNLSSSALEVEPGQCTQLFNYEVNTLGRYQRIAGYERFDGRKAPSATKPSDVDGWPFDTDEEDQAAILQEINARRQLITRVPGAGVIQGIFTFDEHVYAFRSNAEETQSMLYKSTLQGWQLVVTPLRLNSGVYRFCQANFKGSSNSKEVIGVDGVNKAFRFNGTDFTEIEGPITPDAPIDCEVLPSQVLLLAYRNGSFVYSAVGDPTKFDPTDGGGEIACADEIAKMQMQANNSCAIFCRHRTYILYGSSEADFTLENLSKTTGAIASSVQSIGDSIYLDDRGLTRLDRVQAFGNFEMATISQLIDPLLNKYTDRVTASIAIKDKNQYRLCFDDGTGLILTFYGKEVSGFSTFHLGKVVRCIYAGEDERGREVIYFGSDDGFVYQLEKGVTFDGDPVPFVCRPAFYNFRSVDVKKRFRKLIVEADTVGRATINVAPDFDYSDPDNPWHIPSQTIVMGGGGYWDQGTWDESRWSSASVFTFDTYIDGVARNMTFAISGNAINEPPHILNSFIVHYSPRSRRR